MSEGIEKQLRQAIVTIRALRQQVDSLRAERHSPIAVVGMACRLPGHVNDPEALWKLLLAGEDAIVDIPPERWDVKAWYDPDPEVSGRMNTRSGGFVDHIDRFDAAFFEVSAREAAAMDPQQRLLLEVAWEALEDAAIAPDALAGSATGVFIGINGSDYYQMAMSSVDEIDAHAISGGVASVAAGRLSYLMGLNGPAIAVDTACSSSLSAVHLALRSLRTGESRLALAGGVYTVLQPNLSVGLSKLRMMAPDGHCKTFDAAADGFVQGEGCALVVLKRLDDALADQDRILAVLRGSASNQDGRSSSLTAPSRTAQAAVIRAALDDAGIVPERVGYVETHGTGTQLGDPIEVHALADALGRQRQHPVVLGALKTNIGHLGPAAGIAGFVKAVLAVQHGVIPPNLHLQQLNAEIAPEQASFVFPRGATPWPQGAATRIAGVSSFGFAGTNVHVVLEQPPASAAMDATDATNAASGMPGGWTVLCASARSEAALAEARLALCAALHDDIDLAAAARTSTFGRRAFEYRVTVAARTPAEARQALGSGKAMRICAHPRLALRFGDLRSAGQAQGAQRTARALLTAFPGLQTTFDLACEHVPTLRGLLDEHATPEELPGMAAWATVHWALLEQLRQWGLKPALCTGQGTGELLAAAAAGLIPWPQLIAALARHENSNSDNDSALMQLQPTGQAQAILVDASSGEALEQLSSAALGAMAQRTQRPLPENPPDQDSALRKLGATILLDFDVIVETPAANTGSAALPTLRVINGINPTDDAVGTLMYALAVLHAHGLSPDWRSILGKGPRATLPHYPFQRQRHWRKSEPAVPATATVAGSHLSAGRWPPGRRIPSPSRDARFCLDVGVENIPWLADHRVHGLAVVPGAFQIACLAAAWTEEGGRPENTPCEITALTFARPLIAPESGALELWTLLVPDENAPAQGWQASLSAQIDGQWIEYAQARIAAGSKDTTTPLPLDALHQRCAQAVSPQDWRARLLTLGITIGPAFQGIRQLWQGRDEALAEIALPAGQALPEHGWHPALLDACLQVAGGAFDEAIRNGEALLPVGIDRIALQGALRGTLWVHARCTAQGEVLSTDLTIADTAGQVLAVLEGLHVRRAPLERIRDNSGQRTYQGSGQGFGQDPCQISCQSLFHAVEWKTVPLAAGNHPSPEGKRAVLAAAADEGLARQLLARLPGNTLLAQPGELEELLAQHPDLSEVIDLQAWRDNPSQSINPIDLTDPAEPNSAACHDAFVTLTTLARLEQPPRLWLVTRGAVRETPHPRQAAIWGLAATAALEHPSMECRRIDVDADSDINALDALAAELQQPMPAGDVETAICWRDGVRRAMRLQPAPPSGAQSAIQLRDTVLITGGLGGIGREVARWAVQRGAHQLVLASRNAGGEAAEAFAQSLGIPVHLQRVDLSQRAEVERLIAGLSDLPPLRTVIHAAGVQAGGLLASMDWPRFQEALGAKLDGACWLHLATRALPLDHFVLFSSIASLLGAAGQGGYAAANAGLDALARHRRANGLPALSIAWGRWDADGMTGNLDEAARHRIDRLGIAPMPTELALEALDRALTGALLDPANLVIAAVDWQRYREQQAALPATRSLIEDLLPKTTSGTPPTTRKSSLGRSELAALPPEEGLAALLDLLADRFGTTLGGQQVDRQRPLVQQGLDSLLAMEIRNRLHRELGVTVSLAELLGGASLQEIAVALAREIGAGAGATDHAANANEAAPAMEEFRL